MARRDLIVVGASAGGVEALRALVSGFPPDLDAAVLVVLHMPANAVSQLPFILDRAGPLPATEAQDGERIEPGRIYVASPDRHLIVDGDLVRVSRGPRENRHRPAVDVLFRSAAMTRGPAVIGVVLSGTLDDGTTGLATIKRRGGIAVVQSPADALFPGMPLSAAESVPIDYQLPAGEMAQVIARLAGGHEDARVRPVDETAGRPSRPGDARTRDEIESRPSAFACPDCGGVLWELHEADVLRFRCRVGHAYSTDALLASQSDALEGALWAAVRTLEETAALAARLAIRARDGGHGALVKRFDERREHAENQAALIRESLLNGHDAIELQTAGEDTTARAVGASRS